MTDNQEQQPLYSDRIPTLCKQLKLLLQKDLSELESLQKTLADEAEALRNRDTQAISDTAKLKSTLTQSLEDRAKAKVKLITASGAPIHAGKVGEGIKSLGDEELTELWALSLEKLAACKERNQVNGLVIERSRQRNQKIMDMVRGKHSKPKLYGSSGQENAYAGTHTIAKA